MERERIRLSIAVYRGEYEKVLEIVRQSPSLIWEGNLTRVPFRGPQFLGPLVHAILQEGELGVLKELNNFVRENSTPSNLEEHLKGAFERQYNKLDPLCFALTYGWLNAVRYLVEECCPSPDILERRNDDGITPLTCAIGGGGKEVIKYLIKRVPRGYLMFNDPMIIDGKETTNGAYALTLAKTRKDHLKSFFQKALEKSEKATLELGISTCSGLASLILKIIHHG